MVRKVNAILLVLSALALAACGGGSKNRADVSDGGIVVAGGSEATVNRYLWVATLETLNFMPLDKADPYSGVILTDWYANPQQPNERFKATVYILDQRLRADALRVSIFRQETGTNGWRDAPVSGQTATEIENAILTRARQLRLNSIED